MLSVCRGELKAVKEVCTHLYQSGCNYPKELTQQAPGLQANLVPRVRCRIPYFKGPLGLHRSAHERRKQHLRWLKSTIPSENTFHGLLPMAWESTLLLHTTPPFRPLQLLLEIGVHLHEACRSRAGWQRGLQARELQCWGVRQILAEVLRVSPKKCPSERLCKPTLQRQPASQSW